MKNVQIVFVHESLFLNIMWSEIKYEGLMHKEKEVNQSNYIFKNFEFNRILYSAC